MRGLQLPRGNGQAQPDHSVHQVSGGEGAVELRGAREASWRRNMDLSPDGGPGQAKKEAKGMPGKTAGCSSYARGSLAHLWRSE